MPLNKQLESIEESDLQELVDNKVAEGKTIEYKQSLPSNSDREKKEFLADVSSFANAAGGHLIYGVKEEAGAPVEICGLRDINPDDQILRLESSIRNGIAPRIPGVSTRAISLRALRVAMIIRIPKSWALPHMVTFKGHSKFYSRNSAGKYPLDVSELRVLFALSETTAERIRNFRVERLSKIVAGETPVALDETPKIVLHIIPFSAFDPAARIDVSSLANEVGHFKPIYTGVSGYRHNFDGFLTYGALSDSGSADSYLQIFRNGSIEAVDAEILRPHPPKKIIPSLYYEERLIDVLSTIYLRTQKRLNVEPPLFIMLSFLGVSGYTMAVSSSLSWSPYIHPIDRDALLVPEVVVENFDCDPAKVMKPVFDAVWNAAGWPRSMNYDELGKWTGQR